MVRNVGEPGGGPFVCYNQDGTTSLQILESSQIDKNNAEYVKMFEEGTHFNPVDLVCAVKDYKGNHFNLPNTLTRQLVLSVRRAKAEKNSRLLNCPDCGTEP